MKDDPLEQTPQQNANAGVSWGNSQQRGLAILLMGLALYLSLHFAWNGWGRGRLSVENSPEGDFEFRIDVNKATWAELIQLPGIGPGIASRILADREETGPFRDLEDLARVPGIGPATLESVRPHLSWPTHK